ncbi:MAG TPA: NYN domain-containing protein [Chloroflexota bacterium]|nr:NYN domain-containing protein [Chloroflexota bacterium]
MLSQEENFVGLFIDWDNLAISTAVDFAGAVPDVRAIVKAAQRFGTVLLARAYAEWNVSSERLSVYRAGIEPVYAPTFRFEADSGANGSRGKSLADPCLVTDCIDTLHLMPEINVFVLVSGDKDMIPIVRLAQLRGKRVAVIGPDFSAAILRDMADEYIPYRQLAEASDNPPTEVSVHGVRSHRRPAPANRPAPASAPAPARLQAPTRSTPLATAPSPAPAEPNGADHRPETAVAVEAAAEPLSVEELLDPASLFAVISSILREREQAGKPRLRATNLKDQLIARISEFNERKYGFARFKDLLTAAEKAGVLSVTRTGPVQWVTGVGPAATPTSIVEAVPSPVVEPLATPLDDVPEALPSDPSSVDAGVVEFILGLRERSRWLTYTYVLTNLLNHLGNGAADAASDAEARVTLNRLVQAGVLVVDREPREIDVNGTRHRVRLCHVVDEHPLVQQVLDQLRSETAETPADSAIVTAALPAAPEPRAEGVPEEAPPTVINAPGHAPVPPPDAAAVDAALEATIPGAPVLDVWLVEADTAASTTVSPAELPLASASDATADAQAEAPPEGDDQPLATASHDSNAEDATGDGSPPVAALTLAESFAVLKEVVGEATDSNRPTTGPAAVKNRLVRKLGSFDEHSFGFSKFKDYLLSAERAGAIRLEVSGTTTRVALASTAEPIVK